MYPGDTWKVLWAHECCCFLLHWHGPTKISATRAANPVSAAGALSIWFLLLPPSLLLLQLQTAHSRSSHSLLFIPVANLIMLFRRWGNKGEATWGHCRVLPKPLWPVCHCWPHCYRGSRFGRYRWSLLEERASLCLSSLVLAIMGIQLRKAQKGLKKGVTEPHRRWDLAEPAGLQNRQ